MKQCEPNDLLLFAHVAAAGSFSRAAEQIGLPKSTVSRRIAQLEDTLGERLMLRTTRRLAITDFGQQLLEHARQVAAEVDAVKALSEHRQARPSGRLRVSMPNDFATLLLTGMLAAFAARYPAVALELDLSPRRVDLLGEGFDLAVRIGTLPDDSLLVARRLANLPAGLYAAPGYLAARGDPATPDALMHHETLRLSARNGEPDDWTLIGTPDGQDKQADPPRWQGHPPCRVGANSPELLVALARAGAGIAAVPDDFTSPDLRAGRLRRVLPDWRLPAHPVWIVFPGRRLMPAKTRAFIDMLEAALGSADGLPD